MYVDKVSHLDEGPRKAASYILVYCPPVTLGLHPCPSYIGRKSQMGRCGDTIHSITVARARGSLMSWFADCKPSIVEAQRKDRRNMAGGLQQAIVKCQMSVVVDAGQGG